MKPDSNPERAAQTRTDQALYLLCDVGSLFAMFLVGILALILYLPLALLRSSHQLVALKTHQSGGRS